MAGDRKVRQWVIMAAKELGLTATTEGGSNLSMNLTLMQNGYPGLEHAMPIFPMFKDGDAYVVPYTGRAPSASAAHPPAGTVA